MSLPDPGTKDFANVNSANQTQTTSLASYEDAYGAYTQAAINLQSAQDAFDTATTAAQVALDNYSQDLANYNSQAQDVGVDPNPPAPAALRKR